MLPLAASASARSCSASARTFFSAAGNEGRGEGSSMGDLTGAAAKWVGLGLTGKGDMAGWFPSLTGEMR